MKSVILLFAGLAAAQFSELPTCAQSCANTYLQKGIGNCGVDVKCICSDNEFLAGIACCLAQPGGCDTTDQSSAVVFASQLCAAQGVTVPSVVSCTATAASGASDATATTTGSAATATDATPASTATGTTATGTAATGTAATNTAATTAATTTASSSANFAARESVVGAGIVGGIVAALAML